MGDTVPSVATALRMDHDHGLRERAESAAVMVIGVT